MIIMQVSSKKAQTFLTNLKTNMTRAGVEISKQGAGLAAQEYIRSARMAGIQAWRGTFYNTLRRQTTRPVRLSKFTYGVSIAAMKRAGINYFIALDQMKPHFIKLRKNRIITKWAQSKGIKAGAIKVEPHPFISRADKNIIRRVGKLAKKKVRQAARRSKR